MKPQFRLHPRQLADLQAIRGLGASALKVAIAEVKKLHPNPTRPDEIQAVLLRALKENSVGCDALLRQVLSLHGLGRQLNLSAAEIFSGLQPGLQPTESGWAEEEFKEWVAIADLVKEFFELEVIRLSAKALDLSYEHTQLLQRARILTDIRPVFNDDASEVRGTVISHSLLIRFDDPEGDHVLSLAVDEDDIQSLIRQCERALKKSKTARDRLEKAGVQTIMPRKDEND